ncbi:hypothetical protein GCM10020220_063500 [Nonomuraea rubra]|uniref:hypothetical protein n=1 Tax=Nonomuraea rubra TaxID=46180 RepID=UPI0031EC6BA6
MRCGCTASRTCFLGALDPRKNVPNLIRASAAAVKRLEKPPALVLGARCVHETTWTAACREVSRPRVEVSSGPVYLLRRALTMPVVPGRDAGGGLPLARAMGVRD